MNLNSCFSVLLRTLHWNNLICGHPRLGLGLGLYQGCTCKKLDRPRMSQHLFRSASSVGPRSSDTVMAEIDEWISSKGYKVTPQKRMNLIRRKYGKEGAMSGIHPGMMWPTKAELEAKITEENEWEPSLQQMQKELAFERREAELKELRKARIIEANMKKMPKLIAEFKKKEAAKLALEDVQKEKRTRLLDEAREKMGYSIDPRNPKFQQLLADIEKEEKKKKKELRRKGITVD